MIDASSKIATEPRSGEYLHATDWQPNHEAASRMLPQHVSMPSAPLLLVDDAPSTHTRLERILTPKGFAVTGVSSTHAALDAAAETPFVYAVVELRLGRESGLELIKELREFQPSMWIVVVTGFDSFASVALALNAGAVDYLPKPVDERELVNALLGQRSLLPPIPETPLGLKRVHWEYIQRVWEQCDRNVTKAAQQLSMHRRSLQRVLAKHAPCPRSMNLRQ